MDLIADAGNESYNVVDMNVLQPSVYTWPIYQLPSQLHTRWWPPYYFQWNSYYSDILIPLSGVVCVIRRPRDRSKTLNVSLCLASTVCGYLRELDLPSINFNNPIALSMQSVGWPSRRNLPCRTSLCPNVEDFRWNLTGKPGRIEKGREDAMLVGLSRIHKHNFKINGIWFRIWQMSNIWDKTWSVFHCEDKCIRVWVMLV